MCYQSKIIVGIYSYLQDHDDKEIEVLFSNAVDLLDFNPNGIEVAFLDYNDPTIPGPGTFLPTGFADGN